jgi:hypothetical protein
VDASVDEDWEIIWLRAAIWRLAAGELVLSQLFSVDGTGCDAESVHAASA